MFKSACMFWDFLHLHIYILTLLASDKEILLFYRIKKPNIIVAYSYFNHLFLGFLYFFFNLMYAKAFHWSIVQKMLRILVISELQAEIPACPLVKTVMWMDVRAVMLIPGLLRNSPARHLHTWDNGLQTKNF